MEQITDIRIQQKILLEALLHLSRICQTHQLRFFLCNGTLLGAVKYGGFVPWDDDADVMMPREDYAQLMALPDVDSADFRLLSRERTAGWQIPYAKLSHNHTFQQETSADFGCPVGVSLDIFPVDNWQGGLRRAHYQAVHCSLLRRFLSASLESHFLSPRTGVKRALLYGIWVFSRTLGTRTWLRRIDRQRRKGCLSGSFCGCVVWATYGRAEVMPVWQLDSQTTVTFCGECFPTLQEPDAYLRSLYGDYPNILPNVPHGSSHCLKVYLKQKENDTHES